MYKNITKQEIMYKLLQTILIVSVQIPIVLQLFLPDWFSQTWVYENKKYTFKGSYRASVNSLHLHYGFKPDESLTSSSISKPLRYFIVSCDSGDAYSSCSYKCSTDCSFFEDWEIAGYSVLALSILSLCTTTIALIYSFIPCSRIIPYSLLIKSIIFSIGSACYILSFILWFETLKTSFGSCTHDVPYSGKKTICIGPIGYLNYIGTIWAFCASASYFYLSWKLHRLNIRRMLNEKNRSNSFKEKDTVVVAFDVNELEDKGNKGDILRRTEVLLDFDMKSDREYEDTKEEVRINN